MLEEKIVYEQKYNVNTTITIHRYIIILKDGIEISRSEPHTKTICPGDDYSNEDADTQKMCKALWTKSVIEAYKASIPQE
jgi:hypothetical protein